MSYQPAEDSFLLVREIKEKAKGKSVLDMGTGFGILADTAIKAGASSVLAADVNESSVRYCLAKGINAIQSDLFSNIQGKFDLIFFNPPYLPQDEREDKESQQVTTGGKKGDEIIIKFIKNLKIHLKENGVCFLLASTLTPNNWKKEAKKQKLKIKKTAEKKLFMEKLFVWEIRL